jgi:hemolysin D
MSDDNLDMVVDNEVSADFLARRPYFLSHALIWLISGLLIALLVWSGFSKIDIFVSASGAVTAEGGAYPVSRPEAITLEEILVEDGQRVEAGQVVARAMWRQAVQDQAALARAQSRMERSEREASDEMGAEIDRLDSLRRSETQRLSELHDLIRELRAEERLRAREVDLQVEKILMEQDRAQENIRKARLQVEQADRNVEFTRTQLEKNRRLVEKGLVSKLRLLEIEKSAQDANTAAGVARADLRQAKKASSEFSASLAAARASGETAGRSTAQQIERVESELAQLRGREQELSDMVRKTHSQKVSHLEQASEELQHQEKLNESLSFDLKSPAAGTVSFPTPLRAGTVVPGGQSVVEVIPEESELVYEAYVENKDIGLVKAGLPVKIELAAFPKEDYGWLNGKVKHISADAKKDPEKGLIYQVVCEIETRELEGPEGPVPVFIGLAGTAEIVTRRESILNLILKPIRRMGKGGIR